MTSAQLILILVVTLPALALILYPLWRRRAAGESPSSVAAASDRRNELEDEKSTVYRALKELDFDHEAGYVSDEDYRATRERYEARAAQIINALDDLPAAALGDRPSAGSSSGTRAAGSRTVGATVTIAAGVALLLVVGVSAGLLLGRSRAPQPVRPQASLLPSGERTSAPSTVPQPPSADPSPRREPPSKEVLAGMLEDARQHLNQGRYKEAMAGYQAVLQQDPGNVEALTRLGFILATGGHADSALERFNQIISANPDYPLAYFYRGQVLYRAKQDYAGAIRDWERYLALVPTGKDHDNVAAFIEAARAKQRP